MIEIIKEKLIIIKFHLSVWHKLLNTSIKDLQKHLDYKCGFKRLGDSWNLSYILNKYIFISYIEIICLTLYIYRIFIKIYKKNIFEWKDRKKQFLDKNNICAISTFFVADWTTVETIIVIIFWGIVIWIIVVFVDKSETASNEQVIREEESKRNIIYAHPPSHNNNIKKDIIIGEVKQKALVKIDDKKKYEIMIYEKK